MKMGKYKCGKRIGTRLCVLCGDVWMDLLTLAEIERICIDAWGLKS